MSWEVSSALMRERRRRLASGESEVPRDPLWKASDEAGTRADLLSRLAGGPTRGDLAHESSYFDFFLKGKDLALD
jgi:hypothetical protein